MRLKIKQAVLVYQCGIANVFSVECLNMADYGRNAKRIIPQSDYNSAEWFARGLSAAGVVVASAVCNEAGDITHSHWDSDLNNIIWKEHAHPIWARCTTMENALGGPAPVGLFKDSTED